MMRLLGTEFPAGRTASFFRLVRPHSLPVNVDGH